MEVSQIIISIIIFVVTLFASAIIRDYVGRVSLRKGVKKGRTILIKRLLSLFIWILGILLIVFVLGVDIQNIWILITGIITIVAIGFFAIWSLLSNLIAGIILFFSRPFSIGDEIEIMPDKVRGKVEDIHLMFTVIRDKKGNITSVPNNMFFQKIIKNLKNGVKR